MKCKKLLALLLAGVMLTSALTGCGNSSEEASSTGAEATEQESAESASDAENGEKTVVTVWTKDRHDAEFMQSKVDEYNATNTDNIEVKYEIYSDNYVQAVDMVFQNGDAPDMFVFNESG